MLSNINIEDEKFTAKGPLKALSRASAELDIKAILNSIKEKADDIMLYGEANQILNETNVPPGLALLIFTQSVDGVPATLIKGYDYFVVIPSENKDAGDQGTHLANADADKGFLDYTKLSTSLPPVTGNALGARPERLVTPKRKTRLLVKKGVEIVPLRLEDVGLIYTQNKLVFVIDRLSKKYISDKTLSELEEELDGAAFFRANRQYILNINYIKSFKPYDAVKLLVDITIGEMNHSIVISQETAPAFRKWMQDA